MMQKNRYWGEKVRAGALNEGGSDGRCRQGVGPRNFPGCPILLIYIFEKIFKVQKSSKYQNVPTTQN